MHYTDYCRELFNYRFQLKDRLRAVDNRTDLTEQQKKALKTQISMDFIIAKEDLLTPLNIPLKCSQLNQYESYHHPIPLRSNTTSCYITLDSLRLMNLLIDDGNTDITKNIKSLKPTIWNNYFKLDTKSFRRKDYLFHYMI